MNSVAASSASYSLHTAEPNIERSRHTPGGERALPTNIHSSLGVLTAHACPLQLPFFLSFFFLSSKAQTPPQEMTDGHLISRNTPHTQNIQTLFFFFFLSLAVSPGKGRALSPSP